MNGSLLPDESVRIYVEIERQTKAPGEYWGTFLVKSKGDGYRYDKPIYVVMVVGDTVVATHGPEIVTVNPNTGTPGNQIDLGFDPFIDPAFATNPDNYRIDPPIEIYNVEVNENVVTLVTSKHKKNSFYTVSIDSLEDVIGRKSYSITASFQTLFCSAGPELTRSGSNRKYVWDITLSGKRIYTDNTITLLEIPPGLEGSALLQTNTEDATNPNLELSFAIHGEDTRVILALDPNYSVGWHCNWIDQNFEKMEATLPVAGRSEPEHFLLYQSKRTFQPGEIVQLFENGAPSRDNWMYFVLVQGREPMLNLSGNIRYHTLDRPVPAVTVTLSGGMHLTTVTDDHGGFTFWDLTDSLDYDVRPSKSGDWGERTISMYDAALVAQFAEGRVATVPQRVAADVIVDGQIEMDDAREIARFVVELPVTSQVGQWRFLPEFREYPELNTKVTDADFTALVLGDVDGDWAPNASSLASVQKALSGEDIEKSIVVTADEVRIPVIFNRSHRISSFNFSLDYDSRIFEFESIQLSQLGEQFEFTRKISTGQIRFGGFSTVPVTESGEYLQVVLRHLVPGQLPDKFQITGTINGQPVKPVALNLAGLPTTSFLFQNYPNPFNPETRIEYQLAHKSPRMTSVKIFNAKGQIVSLPVHQPQAAGSYSIEWNGTDTNGVEVPSGIYLLSIQSGDFLQVRKMLKLR